MTKQTPSIGDKIILPYDIEDINRIVCEVTDDTFTTEIDGVKETFRIDEMYARVIKPTMMDWIKKEIRAFIKWAESIGCDQG